MENLKEHFIKTLIVVCASISMMLFVTKIVVPIQSNFLPEITLYAALIFPVHGIRVLSAWLFGWAEFKGCLLYTSPSPRD